MENNLNSTPSFPMKWHKFLIYFSLWLSALVNVINAATYGLGLHYDGYADQVYRMYGGLGVVDKLMAVCCIGLAAFSIITRFSLARFEAKGPKLLIRLYVINLVLSPAYLVLASMIAGLPLGEMMDSSTISSIASSAAMAYCNHVYYTKRAELFVN